MRAVRVRDIEERRRDAYADFQREKRGNLLSLAICIGYSCPCVTVPPPSFGAHGHVFHSLSVCCCCCTGCVRITFVKGSDDGAVRRRVY